MIIYKERLSYKDQQKVEQYEKACREVNKDKLFYIFLTIFLVFGLSFIETIVEEGVSYGDSFFLSIPIFFVIFFICLYFFASNCILKRKYALIVGCVEKSRVYNQMNIKNSCFCKINVDGEMYYISKNDYVTQDLKHCHTVFSFKKELEQIIDGQRKVFLVDFKNKSIIFDMTKKINI